MSCSRTLRLRDTAHSLIFRRRYAAHSESIRYRAVIFFEPGDPHQVASVKTFSRQLPSPGAGEVQLRMHLAPINPSDINVIQGVYPMKPRPRGNLGTPHPVFIPGNEGLGEVIAIGPSTNGLSVGDRVVMGIPQPGTWSNYMNVAAGGLITVRPSVSDVQAATMSINPPTALAMLRQFVTLSAGDFVVQNGANSAVGQAVIQIARALGFKTINFVRNRPNFDELATSLTALGADHILTYDSLNEKSIRDQVKSWTGGKSIRLALNCVSGKETASMIRLLGQDAHLVSYGAMSKQPLSLPTSLFIFKNLTAHGFMMSSWFAENPKNSRQTVMNELMQMFENGSLKEPVNEIVTLDASGTDEAITDTLRDILAKLDAGSHGRKVILRFSE